MVVTGFFVLWESHCVSREPQVMSVNIYIAYRTVLCWFALSGTWVGDLTDMIVMLKQISN